MTPFKKTLPHKFSDKIGNAILKHLDRALLVALGVPYFTLMCFWEARHVPATVWRKYSPEWRMQWPM